MRLVDADEIIAAMTIMPEECPGCPEPEFIEDLINVLDYAQEVDAVPVVRCKDCIFWTETKSNVMTLCTRKSFVKTCKDDYCSFGRSVI